MAIATVLDPILQGEPQTFSMEVAVADVVRGQALKISDNGKVAPATVGTRVIGIAMDDKAVGERVTFAITTGAWYVARMLLTESQTVEAGDPLCASSITISGVTTNGLLAKQTDAAFTTWAIATHDDAKINTAGNLLITELAGILTQAKSFVGFALEDKTTTTDEAKVIKVFVGGPSL